MRPKTKRPSVFQLVNHQFWRNFALPGEQLWALHTNLHFAVSDFLVFYLLAILCRSRMLLCPAAIFMTTTPSRVFIEIPDVRCPLTSFYYEVWRFKKSSTSKERCLWTTQHSSRCGLLQLRFCRWILWSWLWWRPHVESDPTDVFTLPRKFTLFYCRRFETSCPTMALESSRSSFGHESFCIGLGHECFFRSSLAWPQNGFALLWHLERSTYYVANTWVSPHPELRTVA